jgi:hypothetical protein
MRVFLSVLTILFSMPCLAEDKVLFQPDAVVEGLSQSEWSRVWWQWAASFDRASSPVADLTGSKCGLKQNNGVWFLAGTYGTHRTVRTCVVPRGKPLFFPLINYVVMPSGPDCCTCESVKRSAAAKTDRPAALVLEIDGKSIAPLEFYRQATAECFDMSANTPASARIFPSAANGYYVMLKPLAPGKHTLNFGGILSEMSQAVTYTIVVR